ncbi:IUNH [Symbiodinium natans]|uniref:IUNH protein n=1 Tax=Symbiodinium natans TaxID=878477 RepID=A0A812SM78_9DINO|nr:IUNH [Symbiodinium natans]
MRGCQMTGLRPSLGFILDDGGRIAEAAFRVGPSRPGLSASLQTGALQMLAHLSRSLPAAKTARKTVVPVSSSRSTSKGKSNSKSRVGGEAQHLGIPHSSRLHPVLLEKGDAVSLQVQGVNEEDQISTCLKVAAEAECSRVKMAFQQMCPYFATLKAGSLVLEVGSRSGDVTLMFAERFPDLYIQPTEGTGEASPGLFMLLQERLSMVRKELPKKRLKRRGNASSENVPRSRVLPPRFLDGGQQKGWRSKISGQDINCIFCVNVLHYVSPQGLENFMQGCSDHLPVGGTLLVCGPFFNNGEAAETLLVYDAALRAFGETSDRKLQWGCHDVVHLKTMGAQVGLSFVAQAETDGVGGHCWILLVFCKERRLLLEASRRRRSSTVQSGLFTTG